MSHSLLQLLLGADVRGVDVDLMSHSLLQLLLGADVRGVATRLLPAVGRTGVKPGVALPADHFVTVVLLSQEPQRRLDDSTTQTQHQMKSRLLLDVIVGKSPSVLELLPSEDQPLLVRGDTLLVLDLGFDIFNGVTRLHL